MALGYCCCHCHVRRAWLLFLLFLFSLDLVWWTKQSTSWEGAPALKRMNVPVKEGKGKNDSLVFVLQPVTMRGSWGGTEDGMSITFCVLLFVFVRGRRGGRMMFFPWDDGYPPLLSAGGGGRKEEAKDYSYVFDALPHAGSSHFLLDTLSSLDSRPPLCISYVGLDGN